MRQFGWGSGARESILFLGLRDESSQEMTVELFGWETSGGGAVEEFWSWYLSQ